MITTVKVLIEGNKKCIVKVVEADGSVNTGCPPRDVLPGSSTTVYIHGAQKVSVMETGEFLRDNANANRILLLNDGVELLIRELLKLQGENHV